jgi:acyl-CoA hydrolase
MMSEPYLAIQVVMMPRDVNPNGALFGGVILIWPGAGRLPLSAE